MTGKFPLKIIKQDNKFRAATSFQEIQKRAKHIRQDLTYIESDYEILMTAIQKTLELAEKENSKRIDARFYWLIGDYILSFLSRVDSLGYYLLEQNTTIGKHLGVSKTTIYRILVLRRKIEAPVFIDPDVPWTKYIRKTSRPGNLPSVS